ncbi:MAG: rhodanese-related sulfurtransferase [Parachlamydiales bacterium]
MEYWVLAYYHFAPVEDPALEVARHHAFFFGRGMTGRIYLSKEGINGGVSGPIESCKTYMEWLRSDSRFSRIEFKIHSHHENAFPRMTVKRREQLVALDQKVDRQKGGSYVSPKEWREMLESGEALLLDVRNDFEWDVGHFEGAERPPCRTFREAPAWARSLKQKHDPKTTKVMMCCTGGIRCELFSALMKEEGFEEVYQLQGGILKYAEEEGGKHWKGKLFVFDDRLAVDINPDDGEGVGRCHRCQTPTDHPYNCANMDCNALFLSCKGCLEVLKGCCCKGCSEGPRVRPLSHQTAKPFRRWHHYFSEKGSPRPSEPKPRGPLVARNSAECRSTS